MSIGKLLFFIAIILCFVTMCLEMFVFVISYLNKEKTANLILKILFGFIGIDICFLISSLIILYFELGGIK